MSTVTDPPKPAPAREPVILEDLLSTDGNGTCIPEASLDDIWPRDDRGPLIVVGKGLHMPPTCQELVPCYEKHGTTACMEFVFSGQKIEPDAEIPLPGAGLLLATAILLLTIYKRTRA